MTARQSWIASLVSVALGIATSMVLAPSVSSAQDPPKSRKERAAEAGAEAEAPKADYSKEFRKLAAPVQTAVNEKKWADVLAALPQLEAIENPTPDDKKAIATWRLQATQGVGDQEAFAAAIESFLAEGYADPDTASSRRITARRRTMPRRSSTSRSSWNTRPTCSPTSSKPSAACSCRPA